jgi:hypothetical protein
MKQIGRKGLVIPKIDGKKHILGMLGEFLHFSLGFEPPEHGGPPKRRTIWESLEDIVFVAHCSVPR